MNVIFKSNNVRKSRRLTTDDAGSVKKKARKISQNEQNDSNHQSDEQSSHNQNDTIESNKSSVLNENSVDEHGVAKKRKIRNSKNSRNNTKNTQTINNNNNNSSIKSIDIISSIELDWHLHSQYLQANSMFDDEVSCSQTSVNDTHSTHVPPQMLPFLSSLDIVLENADIIQCSILNLIFKLF